MEDYCQSFEELLFEPDEALSCADRAKLAEHIGTCEDCRTERELFLDSWQALEELQNDPEPVPAVRARVWEQIRAEETAKLPEPPSKKLARFAPTVYLQRLAVAGFALFLGFHFGQGIRPQEVTTQATAAQPVAAATASPDFIDSDLIELASQEGYSVEIFPESTEFSPIDQETMSALAPTAEERSWIKRRQGAVVPVQYISSQSGGAP